MGRLMTSGVLVAVMAVPAMAAQGPPAKQAAAKRAPAARPPAPPAMTNADVLKLAKAGFSDDLLIARITASGTPRFDLDADALVALKDAGVSERVLAVMLGSPDPGSAQSSTPRAPASTTGKGTVAQPLAVTGVPPPTVTADGEEAGIYVLDAGGRTMLEPTVFSGGKTGGVLVSGITLGFKKAKWKAVVRSPRAVQRLKASQPEFLFIFERQSSGLSHAGTMLGASSPNEFVLARMTTAEHERELVVGQFGTLGATAGTRSEDTVELEVVRESPGVYRVRPRGALPPGEYCFFYAGGMSMVQSSGTGKLFDFGVD